MDADCSKICRTCGENFTNLDSELFPIFQGDAQPHELFVSNKYLSDFLFNVLKIKIYDGMPQNICTECNNAMKTIMKFYDKSENAQEMLEAAFKFKVALISPKMEFFNVDKVETVMSDFDNEECLADKLAEENIDDDEHVTPDEDVKFNTEDDSQSTDSENSVDSEEELYAKRNKRKPKRMTKQSSSVNVDACGETNNFKCAKVCPKCQYKAGSMSELVEHIIVNHPSKNCLLCKKTLVCIGGCNRHYRFVHIKGDKYKCMICDIVFGKKLELCDHSYTVHGVPRYECKICQERFNVWKKYKYHVNSHKYGEFACKICGKVFAQPASLQTHEKLHGSTKPHLCTICGASFVYKSFLERHALSHSTEKPYKCNICDKAFLYKKSYNYHKSTHVDNRPRPFICDQCGKNFVTQSALKMHMPIHSDEKPFECDLCDKAFGSKGNLRIHRSTVHNEDQMPSDVQMPEIMAPPEESISKSKKLPFVCVVCNKGFKLAHSLVKHFKVHSEARGFRCGECPSAFKTKMHLSKHINSVHLKLKPHDCQMCPKKFFAVKDLKVHMRCHTGERPFTCPICNISFTLKKSMEKHVVIHTGVSEGDCKCELCPAEFETPQGLSAHNQLEHKSKKKVVCQ